MQIIDFSIQHLRQYVPVLKGDSFKYTKTFN